jgi:hypothetical protein
MIKIFEEECVPKIHVHAHYNDGKYAYLSWWYTDVPNSHDAYKFCRTQFETPCEINKQMYFNLKENHFIKMIEHGEFRNVFDIGWYRGTDTYYIDKIPPLCILEKYVNEGEWYYFWQYVNYLYKHKKEEIENLEKCNESKCEDEVSEYETEPEDEN